MRKINELSKHNNQAFENDSDLISIPLREKTTQSEPHYWKLGFPVYQVQFFWQKKK